MIKKIAVIALLLGTALYIFSAIEYTLSRRPAERLAPYRNYTNQF